VRTISNNVPPNDPKAGRTIRESGQGAQGNFETAERIYNDAVDAAVISSAERTVVGGPVPLVAGTASRVLYDYRRRPLNPGDPASSSGVFIDASELAPGVSTGGSGVRVREADGLPDIDPTTIITVPNDTLTPGGPGEAILDFNAFVLREVVLGPFTGLVTPGTAINIQTGVYAGAGSPAAVTGDSNVTLPASGAAFKDDGRIECHLNGQDLPKGDGSGNGIAEWVSATQIKLSLKVKPKDTIMVRAPFPTA